MTKTKTRPKAKAKAGTKTRPTANGGGNGSMKLRAQQLDVLALLHNAGDSGLSITEIANEREVASVTVRASVTRLRDKGLLKYDPIHGKKTPVFITKAGRGALAAQG